MKQVIQARAGPEGVITSPENLTASWADLGSEKMVPGFKTAALWLNVDINDSNNVRIRCLAKRALATGLEYALPINTVGASSVAVEDEFFELNVDADQQIIIKVDLDNVVPVIQWQVMAGTLGASAGQIESAWMTLGG